LFVVLSVQLRVCLQAFGNSLGDEWQVSQVHAVGGLEVSLGRSAQLHDTGHIDLVDLGQLSRNVQRLAHAASDNLADTWSLLLGTAQRGNLNGRSSWLGSSRSGSSSWCSSFLSSYSVQNILLADATANAGTLHRSDIDVVLVSQAAYQWGDVAGLVVRFSSWS